MHIMALATAILSALNISASNIITLGDNATSTLSERPTNTINDNENSFLVAKKFVQAILDNDWYTTYQLLDSDWQQSYDSHDQFMNSFSNCVKYYCGNGFKACSYETGEDWGSGGEGTDPDGNATARCFFSVNQHYGDIVFQVQLKMENGNWKVRKIKIGC